MDTELEMKLIECLDALAQGEAVERILARYPQEAAQLRPLLETANSLPALRMEPSEAAKIKSRQQFMAQADLLRRTAPRKRMGLLPRFVTGFAAAAVVAVVLSTGAVAASGTALPGDPLYGLKRTVEDVRLQSASSPTQRQELQHEFEQRRVDETNGLLDVGREGEVEFTGTIESIQPNAWIVSSLVVQLDANTQIVGTPQINRMAEVRGLTGPKGLRATSISIESSGELAITPTPEATEALQATETPEPTETTAPETTTTPQPTRTPQPRATRRPTATIQPTATPQPVELEFTGSVTSMDTGAWSIDGTMIGVAANTEIRGSINVGQRVKVKALRFADGHLIATRIEPTNDGSGNNNSNSNDNQNSNENHNSDDGNSNENNNSNENHNSNENSNSNSNENDNDSHDGNGNDG
jgi:hypothetical protein